MDRQQSILFSAEAESYISTIEVFDIRDIGSPRWVEQHFRLSKLTIQAVLQASKNEEEFIKEAFISYGKVNTAVSNLIITDIWKQMVYPELLKMECQSSSSIPLYNVLHHEAVLVNLLETVLYHEDALQSLENMDQLIDYCYNKIITCLLREKENVSSVHTMQQDYNNFDLTFGISIRSLSILCYISNHVSNLSASVMHRLLITNDIPLLLVELMEKSPWIKESSNKVKEKYFDDKWEKVDQNSIQRLSKYEGLVWVALMKLLLDPGSQKKYSLNDFKKMQILKLRGHINEVVTDQLPCLNILQQFLEQLSIMDPPQPKAELIIDQSSCMRETILEEHRGKWKEIAKNQADIFFNLSQDEIKKLAQRLSDTYPFDVLENLSQDIPRCPTCKREAKKKCSQCQNEWYCSRECQVKHWPQHKVACTSNT